MFSDIANYFFCALSVDLLHAGHLLLNVVVAPLFRRPLGHFIWCLFVLL